MIEVNQLKVILLAKEALVSGDGFSDCSENSFITGSVEVNNDLSMLVGQNVY